MRIYSLALEAVPSLELTSSLTLHVRQVPFSAFGRWQQYILDPKVLAISVLLVWLQHFSRIESLTHCEVLLYMTFRLQILAYHLVHTSTTTRDDF